MSNKTSIADSILDQNCPVCLSDKRKILSRDLDRICNVLKKSGIELSNEDVPSELVQCTNCGHKYSSLILKDEILSKYYLVAESEYYDKVKAGEYDVNWDDVDKANKKLLDTVTAFSPANGSVLEIGCGMGRLLYQLKNKGYSCYGVEPSKFAAQYAVQNFGIDVINGFLDQQTYPGKKFDVIVLSDVVEHITNINSLLDLIHFYLGPSGKIIILTGNSNSLYSVACGKRWLYYYSWEHVSFFNRASTEFLFNKHFFRLDQFKKMAHSGSAWQNIKTVILTMKRMVWNFLRIRKYPFYFMAFDHFIAVGTKVK